MIPRIIHVFWFGEVNPFVEACIARMSEVNPSFTVRRYSNFDEAEYVQGFDSLMLQSKTDWLRLCLVEKYGGIWLDASIICNRCIEESIDVTETRVVGFECPIGEGILENWAFGATPGHPFITEWKNEFGRAINMGFDSYKTHSGLQDHPIYEYMPYLTQHAAFLKVIPWFENAVTMHHSTDSNHGPYFFTKKEWDGGALTRPSAVIKLFLRDFHYPPLLKMTGETRAYVMCALQFIPVIHGSFLGRTLHIDNVQLITIRWMVAAAAVALTLKLNRSTSASRKR